MQSFNYHCHTKICGHAVGTAREYIETAIKSGFKVLGFSEHMGYDDWNDPFERPNFEDLLSYEKEINDLREEYKDKIEILLGYETEYFEDKEDYYKEVLKRVDYLILGQHAVSRNGDYLHDICSHKDIEIMVRQVCDAMEKGLVEILVHPDYFLLGVEKFDDCVKDAFKTMAQVSVKTGIPIELNLKGYLNRHKKLQRGFAYPKIEAWEIMARENPKVVIGYDAHDPKMLLMRNLEREIETEFSRLGLNIIKEPWIKRKV